MQRNSVPSALVRFRLTTIILTAAALLLVAHLPLPAQPSTTTEETSELEVDSTSSLPPALEANQAELPPGLRTRARTKPLTMFLIGDAGKPGEVLTNNGRVMFRHEQRLRALGRPVSMLAFLGDNFYPIGLNHPDEDVRKKLIEDVFTPLRPVMKAIGPENVRAVPGNHDYYCTAISEIPLGKCMIGNYREQQLSEWTYHIFWPASKRYAMAEGSRDSVEVIFFDSGALLSTGLEVWRPSLDSLERMLRASAAAPSVKYRLFLAHHSPYSIGQHGGWRLWVRNRREIYYMGNCWQEGHDPIKYIYQILSNQDNCNRPYLEYSDSIQNVISRAGARVHAFFAGHDHSLQLMYRPDVRNEFLPKVYVISGAGAKRTPVKLPRPPYHFSHPFNNEIEQGRSAGGFNIVSFDGGRMHIWFIGARDGAALDMGGGITEFIINQNGDLTFEKPQR